jgi:hypothetical protein
MSNARTVEASMKVWRKADIALSKPTPRSWPTGIQPEKSRLLAAAVVRGGRGGRV